MKKLLLLPFLIIMFSCSNTEKAEYKKKHMIKEVWNYNVSPIRLISKEVIDDDYFITLTKDNVFACSAKKDFKVLLVDPNLNSYMIKYEDDKIQENNYTNKVHFESDTIVVENSPINIIDNTLKGGLIYKFY